MKNTKKIVLVSDFDGTISKIDFFYYAIDKLLVESDVEPWQEYKAGRITHIEALRRIFAKIRMSTEEFNKFILTLPIEECFVDTVNYCKEKNIDFYIISAGADYYIKLILQYLKVDDYVKLISNNSVYTPNEGLILLESDTSSPIYSYNYGISKKLAVEEIRKDADFIVFAGDGTPDYDAAKLSNVVFARGTLMDLCKQHKLKAHVLTSYYEVLGCLKNV